MNFLILTTLDASKAALELSNHAPLWDAFTTRQTVTGSAHVDTKCIPLRGDLSSPFALGVDRPRTQYAAELPACMALVNKVLAGLDVLEVGVAMLVNLKPGGRVTPHRDEGEYARYFSRMHIVVSSSPGNWIKCANDTLSPTAGQAFLFNHHALHSAGNDSDTERIHLIVDVKLKEPLWHFQQ